MAKVPTTAVAAPNPARRIVFWFTARMNLQNPHQQRRAVSALASPQWLPMLG
jgi:hypothetical protein